MLIGSISIRRGVEWKGCHWGMNTASYILCKDLPWFTEFIPLFYEAIRFETFSLLAGKIHRLVGFWIRPVQSTRTLGHHIQGMYQFCLQKSILGNEPSHLIDRIEDTGSGWKLVGFEGTWYFQIDPICLLLTSFPPQLCVNLKQVCSSQWRSDIVIV